MKKLLFFLMLAASSSLPVLAQNNASLYIASAIPDSLKKDANAVFRLDESILELKSNSSFTQREHQIITLLNKDAAGYLNFRYGIDKFNKVDDLEIRIYNEAGGEVKKIRKKDFTVQAAYDGMSLVTDDKIMYFTAMAPGYPCTIDIQVGTEVSSYIGLPGSFMSIADASIEQFRFQVKVPNKLDIRYRSENIKLDPDIQTLPDAKVYEWKASNILARKFEKNAYQLTKYLPHIKIAPMAFEYDGYPGEMKDWKSFGKWSYDLFEEKTPPFSPERSAAIHSMVKDCKTDREKVNVLYDYLKKNMRYVSIQLGIGGFKPFAVKFVDEKKYGDCKALTNYMRYLLAEVNVKSIPALINAGPELPPVDPTFPNHQFNHVILCVPNGKDSIWLECTSNYDRPGFLGSFTENRYALLLTEKGGILVPTPRSNYAANRLYTKTDIYLDGEGGAQVVSRIFCTGNELSLFEQIRQLNADDKKRVLVQYLGYKQPDDSDLSFDGDSANGYVFTLRSAYSKLYEFNAGSKYFFQQTINRICDEDLKLTKERSVEYLFDHPYEKRDTTIYHLTDSYVAEELLPAKTISHDLASYTSHMNYDAAGHTLIVASELLLKERLVKPEHYTKLAEFFINVKRSEDQKLIIKKQ